MRASHVATSLKVRPKTSDELAKQIEAEHGWAQAVEISQRALLKFLTPQKRGTLRENNFLTINQVFMSITVII